MGKIPAYSMDQDPDHTIAAYLAAFPQRDEYEKMRSALDALGLPYETLTPEPAYRFVGCPVLIMEQKVRSALASSSPAGIICSGWIPYRPAATDVPQEVPLRYPEDLFGTAAIMSIAPCIADQQKVRLIAHLSGDLTRGFPYLNAEMPGAVYNADGPLLTLMDGSRIVTLYPQRIAVAQADNLPDGWRTLEKIRQLVNEVYARRAAIEPLYIRRAKPPAIKIYRHLPGTNCRRCGQKTCMAFAVSLWSGKAKPLLCKPIFETDYAHLRNGFHEIVSRLGFTADDVFPD